MNILMYPSMKDLPEDEKPYEKCERFGPQALSDAELLSVILRTGSEGMSALQMSREIIVSLGDDGIAALRRVSVRSLMKIRGVGRVKALQIKCAAELSRRISQAAIGPEDSLSYKDPRTIARYYMEDLRHETQEIVMLLCLNSKGRVLRCAIISRGTVNEAIITPREIFVEALEQGAAGIILMHNHPSGDPTPSGSDIAFTQMVMAAGKIVGIPLLDHIVTGDMRYVSFKEEGLLNEIMDRLTDEAGAA